MAYVALTVSLLALFFTIASFWWLNARKGAIRAYEPTSWAAYVGRDRSAVRIPLIVHNTGAAAVVILKLRLAFIGEAQSMAWEWTRKTADPQQDDIEDVAVAFSVAGRGVHQFVPEFVGMFPGRVPEQRVYPVAIEAQTSATEKWSPILQFDLQLKNLIYPNNYITYSNDANYLDEHELIEGGERLEALRRLVSTPASEQSSPVDLAQDREGSQRQIEKAEFCVAPYRSATHAFDEGGCHS